ESKTQKSKIKSQIGIIDLDTNSYIDCGTLLETYLNGQSYKTNRSFLTSDFKHKNADKINSIDVDFFGNTLPEYIETNCFIIMNATIDHRPSKIGLSEFNTFDGTIKLMYYNSLENSKIYKSFNVVSSGKTIETSARDF